VYPNSDKNTIHTPLKPKLYILILHPVPLFIYTSCWTPTYTYFMLDPYLYILHAGPLFIHTSCCTPIYTYFMLYPYLYILHAGPLFIHTSCCTPIFMIISSSHLASSSSSFIRSKKQRSSLHVPSEIVGLGN